MNKIIIGALLACFFFALGVGRHPVMQQLISSESVAGSTRFEVVCGNGETKHPRCIVNLKDGSHAF